MNPHRGGEGTRHPMSEQQEREPSEAGGQQEEEHVCGLEGFDGMQRRRMRGL